MPSTAASLPVNETDRLATLRGLEILDTLPEQAYDDLTVLASQVCGTPIAMVALIDAERQWYKSTIGTTLRETQRNVAFCAHAILRPDEIFTVEDAASDPRFDDNPFVAGEPHIRFYAGAPIVMSSGEAIGTMCVIDTHPRTLTDAQRQCLTALARQASLLLDLRAKAIASERIARENEQLTVEARLKQKRGMELLELVLRGGQMGLWDLHVPTGVWTVNAREQMMLGYAGVESASGKLDWRSLVHPDDWPALTEAMEPHLNGRAAFYECTHRMRHADGRDIWVLHRGVIVERNVRGEALRIVGTHVDVTEQHRLDEERQRNIERLELALSGDDSGLWDWRVDRRANVFDARWARLFGYTQAEVDRANADGPMWKTMVHPADGEAAHAAFERYRLGLVARFEVEVRLRHKNGRMLWVRDRGIAVERDANGHAVRIIGTTTVIDERKNNEFALRQANDLLVRTGRLARVGGWSIDFEAGTVVWSDEIYRLHDLNPAAKPDLTQAIDFFTPASRPIIEAAIKAARTHGTPWDLELSLTTARGRPVWIRTLATVECENGKPVLIVGTVQDITDRKEAELQRVESERSLRVITDSLPSLITRLDRDERYTFVNKEVERVFNIDRKDMTGRRMRDVQVIRAGMDYAKIAAHVKTALSGETVIFEGYTEVRGRPYYYQTHYAPDINAAGQVTGFFTMTFDITERKRAEMRRTESEERLRGVTDNLPVMIAEIDTKGRFRFVNETYRTWLGADPAAMLGRHVGDATSVEYYAGRRDYLERARRGEKVSFEQPITLACGIRWLQTTYLPHFDAAGSIIGIYALTSDITELKETQSRLDTLARFDPLTGLANRRQFEEKLDEAMARTRRSTIAMAVLYLDIDRFKAINDSHGHAAGDAVLVECAARLRRSVREIDLVARHAGDEFVVVLEGLAHDDEAIAVADKLVAAMRAGFVVPDGTLSVRCSIGVATYRGGALDAAALVSLADRALYRAKSGGGDRVLLATG